MASSLIISTRGDGVPIALRLVQEGHIAKINFRNESMKLKGYQNPSQVGSPKLLDQYDLILFDSIGLGAMADEIKRTGRLVFCGDSVCDKLESDSEYSLKVVSKLTKLSIATELPDGVAVEVEGWFNGERFVCFNHSIGYRRLMEGEIGPVTQSMGSVIWVVQREGNELIARSLQPLEQLLNKINYLGPISVNLLVTEKDLFFLDFFAGFRYDKLQAWTELLKGSLFDFLWQVASKGDHIGLRSDYGISVRLVLPPYLSRNVEMLETIKGRKVLEIPQPARNHVFLSDVMRAHDTEDEVIAGEDGIVGCVTARGTTIQECRRRVYRTISNSVIDQEVMYRKDIGAGVERVIGALKEWGWLDA